MFNLRTTILVEADAIRRALLEHVQSKLAGLDYSAGAEVRFTEAIAAGTENYPAPMGRTPLPGQFGVVSEYFPSGWNEGAYSVAYVTASGEIDTWQCRPEQIEPATAGVDVEDVG